MSLVNTNKLEANKYELTIKVDAESFAKAIDKAYKKNVKKINVPGFRQGKAPKNMVEKLYGEGVFFEDAINELYPTALAEAIEEAKLEVVARPEVEMNTVEKADGFEFVATCIVKPEVEVKNYKGIEAEKTVKAVEDADIDTKVEEMRNRNSRLVDVTDRATLKGDTVTFDFDGYVDDVAFDGGKAESFSLELGSGQFIPGFEEQMEGKNIDEEFDVKVTFPEEYQAEELKGKEATFKCKLHEIKGKELPELDDEFAKDVSEFDTLDAFKADLKAKMVEAAEKEATDAMENKLIDVVIENMVAEIPNEMNEARIDEMVHDFEYRLQSQGMNIDTYLQYTGMPMESFRQTFEEQAAKQVKIRLALEKIVELEAITVPQEDIDAEYQKVADSYKMELEKVKSFIPEADFTKDLAVNKAIELIIANAVITPAK